MRQFSLHVIKAVVVVFALIGAGLCAVYVGVNLHVTDASGIMDQQADVFWENGKITQTTSVITSIEDSFFNGRNYCLLEKLKVSHPGTFWRILTLALNGQKLLAQNNLDVAVQNLDMQGDECERGLGRVFSQQDFKYMAGMVDSQELFVLSASKEWSFFKTSALKDVEVLKRVESETGVNSRTLVAIMVAEQMRLFYSDRAWFEQMIAPSKVLASMSQFSLGVLGIKSETALNIERNLKNPDSEFYPGPQFEHILDFKTTEISDERFKRLTDSHDHYYSYLYTAMYCKELIAQWKKRGFDISDRPEILATLFNIGFVHSSPNADPKTGGAAIDIGEKQISFGALSYNFYYSGELLDEFPQ